MMLVLPRKVEELGEECVRTASVDAVHDLRVATRRLREALRLFGPWMPEKETVRLRKRLRRITRGLGPVRDQDVALEFFAARKAAGQADWPEGTAAARGWVLRRCAILRRTALPEMRRLIEAAGCGRVLPEVERLVEGMCSGPGSGRNLPTPRELAPQVFRERMAVVLEHRDVLPPERGTVPLGSDWREPMHRTRIALKKLRYAMELLRPAEASAIEACLSKAKSLQDAFGTLQDLVTFGRMLEPDTPESLLAAWAPQSYRSGLMRMRELLRALGEKQARRASGLFHRRLEEGIRPTLALAFPDMIR